MSRVREAWDEGRVAFGAWVLSSTPSAIEVLAAAGFDYICIDAQHGLLGYEEMRDLLLALKGTPPTPMVRVPSNDFVAIGKALDAGAEGIIVPLVNSGAEAQAAARACRYPPDGDRSFGPARAHQPRAQDVMCFPMIETREALDQVEAICATSGVDGIYIGPADLGLALGCAPFSASHDAAALRVRDACTNAGVIPGMHALNGIEAAKRAEQGFRMVTATSDVSMLGTAARTELFAARG